MTFNKLFDSVMSDTTRTYIRMFLGLKINRPFVAKPDPVFSEKIMQDMIAISWTLERPLEFVSPHHLIFSHFGDCPAQCHMLASNFIYLGPYLARKIV